MAPPAENLRVLARWGLRGCALVVLDLSCAFSLRATATILAWPWSALLTFKVAASSCFCAFRSSWLIFVTTIVRPCFSFCQATFRRNKRFFLASMTVDIKGVG